MSSQGPATSYSDPTGTSGPKEYDISGYPFSPSTIRDSSGWTEFLKQKRIVQEGPVGDGQNRRLDFLNGQFKLAGFGCTGCTGGAFNGS